MNPNYNATVTLYNCRRAADSPEKKESWKRTLLCNVFWKAETTVTQSGTQASKSNTYTVRIPRKLPVNPEYHPYAEWKTGMDGFTVSEGDIVILGNCQEEITGVSGQTAAQVLARHKPDAFKVTAFADNTGFPMGKHYRLGG